MSKTMLSRCVLVLACLLLGTSTLAWSQSKSRGKPSVPAVSVQTKTTKAEMAEYTEALRTLMLDLYTQHPEALAKNTQVGPREMTEWVFEGKSNWKFDAIRGLQVTDALDLALQADYTGDRILPLLVGLETLLFTAYGGKNEFDIPSGRDGGRLQQAYCALVTLQSRLDHAPVVPGQPTIFDNPASSAMIGKTLNQLRAGLKTAIQDFRQC